MCEHVGPDDPDSWLIAVHELVWRCPVDHDGRHHVLRARLWGGTVPAGRVDAVVQSTDKNFLVPVGGAIVSSFHSLGRLTVEGCIPGDHHRYQWICLI